MPIMSKQRHKNIRKIATLMIIFSEKQDVKCIGEIYKFAVILHIVLHFAVFFFLLFSFDGRFKRS